MTPVLFDLPLRLSDATVLARILLDQPASLLNAPLTDEYRTRLAGRAAAVEFQALTPFFGSLERDPIHHSAWYVCVDGEASQPLLLRIAPASAPSSGLFPKALLIGRTFIGPVEVVLNAVAFGSADRERILSFSEKINKSFNPRPARSRPVIRVIGGEPDQTFPAAFLGFRKLFRATGRNVACFGLMPGQDPSMFYYSAVWAAIRSGWRDGFSLHSDAPVPPIPGVRGRPFETSLTISRDIVLSAAMTKSDILEQF